MEMGANLAKFIPFTKVNLALREVSGIVTAERPDKEYEVCDYEKSKPYYKAWSEEFAKSTDGKSLGNLREMHQLSAVGKALDLKFNDPEKEIEMTFKVVDDEAWKKVEERVYTGFSQGGRKVGEQVPDPVFKGCQRYVANPIEISLVDNPCLPDARFAVVKLDGTFEMCKFLHVELPKPDERIAALEQEVSLLKAATTTPVTTPAAEPVTEKTDKEVCDKCGKAMAECQCGKTAAAEEDFSKEARTKRVGGKDLKASSFAYVGDPEKTETWKLPIHDASHVRNALARFNQTQGIPSGEKPKVLARIKAAARRFGIDVAGENDKVDVIKALMRRASRVYVNQHIDKIVSPNLAALDYDMGKLNKGMFEVSRLAESLETLAYLVFAVSAEQEWEGDEESGLPEMLSENVSALTETLIQMVDEETRELLEQVQARVK